MMTRRTFLRATVPTVTASVLCPTLRATVKPAPVVDTHLHCFAGAADVRFPYHANGPYRPEKSAPPELLLECMNGAGVDFAVVVHPEPYQDDHRYLEHCLDLGGKRLKGTCLFFAGQPRLEERMTELVKRQQGRIVAARVHAYAPERQPPFGKPELRALWKLAANLGLMLQLHFEPRFARGFEPLIREFKETRVIIDHLGRPMQGTPEEHAAIVNWARFPNTVMKISALPEVDKYPHREVGPIIRQLTAAFGADRMIFGGGFGEGATAISYRAYREKVRGLLAHLSAADQAKIFGGTAVKLFGF